jgi:lysine 2,3-aminomutase
MKELYPMKDLALPSKRAKVYQDIPDEKWNDWRWQLSHRLNTVEDFEKFFL